MNANKTIIGTPTLAHLPDKFEAARQLVNRAPNLRRSDFPDAKSYSRAAYAARKAKQEALDLLDQARAARLGFTLAPADLEGILQPDDDDLFIAVAESIDKLEGMQSISARNA